MKDKIKFLDIVKEKKGLLIISAILSVITGLLQLVPFISVYKIIEIMFLNATQINMIDSSELINWGIYAFVAMLLSLVTTYISGMCSHVAAFDILYKIRIDLTNHIANVSLGYHTVTPSGEIKKIIEASVEKLETFIAHQLPDLVSGLLLPVIMIIYLYYLDWRLAIISTIVVVIALTIQFMAFGKKSGKTAYANFNKAMEVMSATGVEYIRGMPAVKVFGLTASSFLSFKKAVDSYKEIALAITMVYKLPYSLFQLIISSIYTYIVPFGLLFLYLFSNNVSYAIVFIFFLIITPALSSPLHKLMYISGGLREISASNDRINSIYNEPVTIEPEKPLMPTKYDIRFNNVSFAYNTIKEDEVKTVLSKVSFEINTGKLCALVGPSGSGKSTIASLLLRFWDIEQGDITIGNIPIQNIGSENLMKITSFVFQDVHLFKDTIEQNIRMGNETATTDDVYRVAKIACCHDFIEELQEGYQTKIGEGGIYLSGGESQRIAIARALLKDAPILVLDEATAYADAQNEYDIQQGLNELVKNKTVLVIAHRLSSIQNADNIIVLDRGRIAEQGKHAELLEKEQLYSKMWDAHINAQEWKLTRNKNLKGEK